LARKAGLINANVLYNFLNGHSYSISQSTLEKLAKATGTKVDEMFSEPLFHVTRMDVLDARTGVFADKWNPTYEYPGKPLGELPIPRDVTITEAGFVCDASCDPVYPQRTILGIASLTEFLRRGYLDGDRVLVHRRRNGQHEITIRQIVVAPDNQRAELRYLSPTLDKCVPVKTWPYHGGTYPHRGDHYQICGRVVASWFVEEGA